MSCDHSALFLELLINVRLEMESDVNAFLLRKKNYYTQPLTNLIKLKMRVIVVPVRTKYVLIKAVINN